MKTNNSLELETTNLKKSVKPKTVSKKSSPLKSMPQTYVEDTFTLYPDGVEIVASEVIITNELLPLTPFTLTLEELLVSKSFNQKVTRLIDNVRFEKSFNSLLDYMSLVKMYKVYSIDDTTDEIDILLREVVNTFRQRLSKISLTYEIYQKVNLYFDSVISLYNRFKTSNEIIKDDLTLELNSLLAMENYMKANFFSYLK
jgi:hypothetical protein